MSPTYDLDETVLARMRDEIGAPAAQAAMASFRTEMLRRAALLAAASEAGDLSLVRSLLHQIKGSARTFGATDVARLAAEGDAKAHGGHVALALELAQQTAIAIERTLRPGESP